MAQQIPDQQGRLVVTVVPNPGVGLDWAYAVPAQTRWRLRSVQATLTTSIVAGNRLPELAFAIGGNELLRISASQIQLASLAFITGWMEGERALAIVGQTSRVSSLPRGYLLNAGAQIAVFTVALNVGDQWSDIVIVSEEWIEPLV